MKNSELISKRKYAVTFITGESIDTHWPTLSELLADDNDEWKYAAQEQIDKILDLKNGDVYQMYFNRDSKDSLGLIKRIS